MTKKKDGAIKSKLWEPKEDEILLSHWPKIRDALKELPGRTYNAAKNRYYCLKVEQKNGGNCRDGQPFSVEEITQIKAGATYLPGRSRNALKSKRMHLGVKIGNIKPWSDDEVAMLKAGAEIIPGRTHEAIKNKRLSLKIFSSKVYTKEEDDAIRNNPFKLLEGRTIKSWKGRRRLLGIRLHRWEPNRVTYVNKVEPSHVIAAVSRAVPAGIPRHVRDEIMSDIYLAIYQGDIHADQIPGFVAKAKREVYKRYPVLGAPISLDAPIFDDGKTTLIERISADDLASFW